MLLAASVSVVAQEAIAHRPLTLSKNEAGAKVGTGFLLMTAVSERRVLTARNLFDDIFATIPEHLSLFRSSNEEGEEVGEMLPNDEGNQVPNEGEDEPNTRLGASLWAGPSVAKIQPQLQNQLELVLDDDDVAVKEAKTFHTDEPSLRRPVPSLQLGGNSSSSSTTVAPRKAVGNQQITQQRRQDNMTAEEQLRLMPPGTEDVHKGVVVLFNHIKGFGFVSPAVGGPDVYVTRESISLQYARRLLSGDTDAAERDTAEGSVSAQSSEDAARRRYAQLLVENTKPFLLTGETVEFLVSVNANSSSNSGSADRRRLRAVNVTGPSRGPIQIERSLLQIPTERKSLPAVRVKGVVRNVSREQERGYIRPSDGAGHDAVFFSDTVAWDQHVSSGDRVLRDGTLVEYTVIGKEKNGKPRAGLVTADGGAPMVPSNIAPAQGQGKRDEDEDGDGHVTRKRARGDGAEGAGAQQQMLLLEDDAYGGGW